MPASNTDLRQAFEGNSSIPGSPAGADNQSAGILVASIVTGALISVGLEIRLWLSDGVVMLPVVAAAMYCLAVLLIAASIDWSSRTGMWLRFQGRRRYVRFVEASPGVGRKVKSISEQLQLPKSPTVLVVPHTSTSIGAFAVGSRTDGCIVLTRGAELLAYKEGSEYEGLFEFLIRHEAAHILRNDPDTSAYLSAVTAVGVVSVFLKAIVLALVGSESAASWYQPLFPRSFALSSKLPVLENLPPTSRAVLVSVLLVSLCLFLLLAALTWVVIRRREYWADHFAVRSYAVPGDGIRALEVLLQSGPAPASRPLALNGSRLWHPTPRARMWHVRTPLPRAGFYSTQGAILVVGLVFVFRYVFGNNSGLSPADYSLWPFTGAFQIAYVAGSFLLLRTMVCPLDYTTKAPTRWEALRSLIRVCMIIVLVTAVTIGVDAGAMLVRLRLPFENTQFDHMIALELFERVALLGSIGVGLVVFAIAAFAQVRLLSGRGFFRGLGAALAVLWIMSKIFGPYICSARSNAADNPEGSTPWESLASDEDTYCDVPDLVGTGVVRSILRLCGGYLPFNPPLDAFLLVRGPTSVTTWNGDESAYLSGGTRRRLQAWYAAARTRNPTFSMEEKVLFYAYSVIQGGNEGRLPSLRKLKQKRRITSEEQHALDLGLGNCIRKRSPNCVRLALELGANPNATTVDSTRTVSALTEAYPDYPTFMRHRHSVELFCEMRSLKRLIEGGANADREPILARAVEAHDTATVVLLLESGANPNRTTVGGVTPLMLAVGSGDSLIAARLLSAGADTLLRDDVGRSARDYELGRDTVQ